MSTDRSVPSDALLNAKIKPVKLISSWFSHACEE